VGEVGAWLRTNLLPTTFDFSSVLVGPLDGDTDGDQIDSGYEELKDTDPLSQDTDGDGLVDGVDSVPRPAPGVSISLVVGSAWLAVVSRRRGIRAARWSANPDARHRTTPR